MGGADERLLPSKVGFQSALRLQPAWPEVPSGQELTLSVVKELWPSHVPGLRLCVCDCPNSSMARRLFPSLQNFSLVLSCLAAASLFSLSTDKERLR
jgi:hypothetical protein